MNVKEIIEKNFPFILFLVVLGVIYIANAHMAERTIRDVKRIKSEIKEVKAEYIALEKELKKSRSEIGNSDEISKAGLKKSIEVPEKVIIKERK